MKIQLLWSSVLGTAVGIIPGAGASISAFVAYGEAKRISKTPELFGKGSYEGVAAPEAANNAVVGGALVPLLALGIPGSGSAAIMFGALTIHGILAGPRLFTERADIVYTFMVGLLVTVFAMLIIGLATIRWSSLIVRTPRRVMVPAVLVLSVIGSYGLNNNLFDIYVLLIVGVIAYMLAKVDVPVVTIALGLVLGSLMEESFQQAALVGQVDFGSTWLFFASRPLALALMAVAFVIIALGVTQILRDRRAAAEAAIVAEPGTRRGVSLRTANILLGGLLVALAVYVVGEARAFTDEGAQFPNLVAGAFIVLGGILFAVNVYPRSGAYRSNIRPFDGVPWRVWGPVVAALALFALGTDWIGFYESAFLFLLFTSWLLSGDGETPARRLGIAAIFAAVFVTIVYIAFRLVLQIPTPHGLIV
jgi:putative tricarboxylic transport membrane protein